MTLDLISLYIFLKKNERGHIRKIIWEITEVHLPNAVIDERSRPIKISNCTTLEILEMPSLSSASSDFGMNCVMLTKITLDNLFRASQNFLKECVSLKEVNLPNLETGSVNLCSGCISLETFIAPKLTKTGNYSLFKCYNLKQIDVGSLSETGTSFMKECNNITEVDLPELLNIKEGFMCNCRKLTSVSVPKVEKIKGNNILINCLSLCKIHFPNVREISSDSIFLGCLSLKEIKYDSLEVMEVYESHCKYIEKLIIISHNGIKKIGTPYSYNFENSEEFGCLINEKRLIRDKSIYDIKVEQDTKIDFHSISQPNLKQVVIHSNAVGRKTKAAIS